MFAGSGAEKFCSSKGGRANRRAYWRFAPGSHSEGHRELDLEEELSGLVRASARRHLGDPAKTIIFLSGGADSRGILGAALDAVGGDGHLLNTVSSGVSEGEQKGIRTFPLRGR